MSAFVRVMTMDAGIGLRPSRAATASCAFSETIVVRYSSSASSLLLYVTSATPSYPLASSCREVTSAVSASSARKAWIVMRDSTSPTTLLTMRLVMANRPMMNSDRKMVTTAPRLVDQLREK